MNTVQSDIEKAINIIHNNITTRDFDTLYRNTNENLSTILSQYDFQNKNVLAVQASSDQMFSAYYLGAKNVDTFDVNRLTYYYYFLKKWTLMATEKVYIPANNDELLSIIEMHDNSPKELEAYYFWKSIINSLSYSLYYSNLFYKSYSDYKLPYFFNPKQVADILEKKDLNFSEANLFKDNNLVNKKYDIIVLSNVLEYLYIEAPDIETIKKTAKNLNSMLNPGGIIISSNLIDYDYNGVVYFEKYFDYKESPHTINYSYGSFPINYSYTKKR